MPDLADTTAGSVIAALILYALQGGADFGGGVWVLLSRGRRAALLRRLVADAIGPVWETNHIWVVIAAVVLMTGFPQAFAAISTSLFVPVTLMLIGIVLRGAAFAFHSHRLHEGGTNGPWETVFAVTSLLTPFFLGTVVGSLSSGEIRLSRGFVPDVGRVWLTPLPLSVGLLAVAIFSHLAAVYLIFETDDDALREDFRSRALWSSAAVGVLLFLAAAAARGQAPAFFQALFWSEWSVGLVFLAATAALGGFMALLLRTYPLARICAAALTTSVLAGWGLAQHPYLVRPDLSIAAAASPASTLRLILLSLGAGALFLFPAIYVLLRVFKKEVLSGRPPNRRDRPPPS
jgi:cytochrome d ubiquinol oxidase subunit II